MTSALEITPGLNLRGFTPPWPLGGFKLLAFGMDSALLPPDAKELICACIATGMCVDMVLGGLTDSTAKWQRLHATCANLGVLPDRAVVIGRAESDLAILSAAGLSVAFMAPPAVANQAMVDIRAGGMAQLLTVVTLAVATGPAPLDLSVLDTLVNHDATKFRKFALLAISSLEAALAEVDSAIAQDDLPLLMAMGHRAKSTARSLGAVDFANDCLQLEQRAQAQDRPAALQIARRLRPAFDTIRWVIAQRLSASA